ncbi:MAG: tetratricopeptide repeat protein [Candidatus Hodarchaeales archaeon]
MKRSEILNLVFKGKFQEAWKQVETFEKQEKLAPKDQIKINTLKSYISIAQGKYKEGLKYAEEGIIENQQFDNSTEVLDALIAKAKVLEKLDNFDESLKEIERGEKIINSLKGDDSLEIKHLKAELTFQKGRTIWRKRDYDSGLNILEQSLRLFKELNDKYGIALCQRNLGTIHRLKKESKIALEYFQKGLQQAESTGFKQIIAECLFSIGDLFLEKKIEAIEFDEDRILDYLNKSLSIFEELENKSWISTVLIPIGEIYMEKGERSRGYETFQKIILLNEEDGSKAHLGHALNEISSSYYLSQGEFDHALKYGLRSLAVFEEIKHEYGVANVKDTVGWIYFMKGELDVALDYLHQSMAEFSKLDKFFGTVYPPAHLADVYQAKRDYNNAIEYANQALILCEEVGFQIMVCQLLFRLVSIHLDINQIEDAKEHFQKLNDFYEKKFQKNKYVSQLSRLAEGHILKHSSRLRDKMKAQELFEQITEEPVVFFPNSIDAMFNLCDLLLMELKVSGDENVFHEAKNLIQKLIEISRKQQSHSTEVNALILQTKFTIIEGDLSLALKIMDQAGNLSKEKNLTQLTNKVLEEKKQIEKQFEEWEKLIRSNATLQARLEKVRLDDYISNALKMVKLGQKFPES